MKFDAQHIILLVLAGLMAALPAVLSALVPGSTSYIIVSGAIAFVVAVLAMLKASPVDAVNAEAALKAAVTKATTPLVCLALACLFLVGCAGINQALVDQVKANAAKDATSVAACVVGQVVSGNEDAAAIAITCGIPAAADAVAIATELAKALEQPASDAGVGAAPATDRLTLAMRLRAVH